MKRRRDKSMGAYKLIVGLAIIITGLYFHSWWGAIGAIPILITVVDFCHGLFTFRELHF